MYGVCMTEFGEDFLQGALDAIEESRAGLEQLGAAVLSYAEQARENGVTADEKAKYEQIAPAIRGLIDSVSRDEAEIAGQDIPLLTEVTPAEPASALRPEPNARTRRVLEKLGTAPIGEEFRAREAGLSSGTLTANKNEINRFLRYEQPPLHLISTEEMPGGARGMFMLVEMAPVPSADQPAAPAAEPEEQLLQQAEVQL